MIGKRIVYGQQSGKLTNMEALQTMVENQPRNNQKKINERKIEERRECEVNIVPTSC